jgi:hypothetical protein
MSELSDKEINERVAVEVMQWERVETDNTALSRVMFRKPNVDHLVWPASVPDFATDIAAAMEVEDRIAELDLRAEYAAALQIVVAHDARDEEYSPGLFGLIHATPRQRCLAALAATGGE